MALMHIPLDQITRSHLQGLIEAGAPETLQMEYKRETYGGNDESRREFLADVSSFANTRGGDLVIGVAAENGVPTELVAFTGNADAEILRLDNMALHGLEPRIPNLHIRAVSLEEGGAVLVIRVPRSYRIPHRVIFRGSNRFYARASAGRYEPDVEQLRALFVFAPELSERMRGFRFDRIANIAADQTPARLLKDPSRLVLHVVPFSYFGLSRSFLPEATAEIATLVPPIGTRTAAHWQPNFDGFLTLSNRNDTGQSRGYVQVFRGGVIEAVTCSIARANGAINTQELDFKIVQSARTYARALREWGVEPPFAVMASIIGITGRRLGALFEAFGEHDAQIADRDQLHLTDVVFEDVPEEISNYAVALRPMLDHLANAAGRSTSASYDAAGNWADVHAVR